MPLACCWPQPAVRSLHSSCSLQASRCPSLLGGHVPGCLPTRLSPHGSASWNRGGPCACARQPPGPACSAWAAWCGGTRGGALPRRARPLRKAAAAPFPPPPPAYHSPALLPAPNRCSLFSLPLGTIFLLNVSDMLLRACCTLLAAAPARSLLAALALDLGHASPARQSPPCTPALWLRPSHLPCHHVDTRLLVCCWCAE